MIRFFKAVVSYTLVGDDHKNQEIYTCDWLYPNL